MKSCSILLEDLLCLRWKSYVFCLGDYCISMLSSFFVSCLCILNNK